MRPPVLIVVLAWLAASPAGSHEFWIDPVAFRIDPGDTIAADLRVGQGYEGSASVYMPGRFRRFEIATPAGLVPVEGRLGDRPALQATAEEGLAVAIHVTTDSRLTYQAFETFETFVREKGEEWALEAHAGRGLPQTGFGELFSRHAKALIAVGDGSGDDRAFGLETEIVALANPYTDDVSGGLPVRVLYLGAPRAGARIDVFEKAPDGAVVRWHLTTDDDGRATVGVRPGHRYMLDSVVLREPAAVPAERRTAVWESLWANLTFEVPG